MRQYCQICKVKSGSVSLATLSIRFTHIVSQDTVDESFYKCNDCGAFYRQDNQTLQIFAASR